MSHIANNNRVNPNATSNGSEGRRALTHDEYVGIHHMTSLPESIRKFKAREYSVTALEQQMQMKIGQHTAKDSDRMRQVLKIFKAQAERGSNEDDPALGITRTQFRTVLSLLGVFCTPEQASQLFDRYDMNKDGALSAWEFLTRARPQDYQGQSYTNWIAEGYHDEFKDKGKRIFLRTSLTGNPVPASVPNDDVYHLTVERIANRMREKIAQTQTSGHTASYPRMRRYMSSHFEFHDKENTGLVNDAALRSCLQRLGFALSPQHRALLFQQFGRPGGFDYRSFVLLVYPLDLQPPSTSLYLTHDAGTERLATFEKQNRVRPDFHDADDTPSLKAMLQSYPTSLAPTAASTLYDPQLATPRGGNGNGDDIPLTLTATIPRPPSAAAGGRPGSSRAVRPLSASSAGRAAMLTRHREQIAAINAASQLSSTSTSSSIQPPYFMLQHVQPQVATTRLTHTSYVRPSSARPAAATRAFNIGTGNYDEHAPIMIARPPSSSSSSYQASTIVPTYASGTPRPWRPLSARERSDFNATNNARHTPVPPSY